MDKKRAYLIQTWLVRLALGLSGCLSMQRASALGGWLARRLGPYSRRTRTVMANLGLAMPELSKVQADTVMREMWDNLGRTFAEFPHMAAMPADAVELVGLEHLQEADRSGTGSIFFTGHLANWEAAARAFAHAGYPLTVVFRPVNNPGVESRIQQHRRDYIAGAIAKGQSGSRQIIRALAAGERIGIFVDQKMNDGIPCPFFGVDAMTAPAIARLALKYGYPIYPTRTIRLADARFRVIIYPRLEYVVTGDIEADMLTIMTAINRIMESWIREYPGQWFWVHRRWPAIS